MGKDKTNGKQKLWSGLFIVICMIALCTSLVMRLLDNTLAIYADDLFSSKSYGGLLTSAFTFGSIVASLFCGNITDRVGRQKLLLIGAGTFAVTTIGMVLTNSQPVILVIRAIQGAARAFAMVATAAMAADIIPKERMAEGMGYYGLGSTLASAFGPALGLWMISGGNYNLVFLACVGIYAAEFTIALFIRYERNRKPTIQETPKNAKENVEKRVKEEKPAAQANAGKKEFILWRFLERGALPVAAAEFIINGANVTILVYLTLYARDTLGFDNSGLFFTLAAIGMVVARLGTGRIVDRVGALPVLLPMIGLCIINNFILSRWCVNSNGLFLAGGVIYGLCQGSIYPALQAIAVVDSPANRRATATSTITFGMDLGILVSSAIMGVVLDATDYVTIFDISTVMYIFGAALVVVLLNNRARARQRKRHGIN